MKANGIEVKIEETKQIAPGVTIGVGTVNGIPFSFTETGATMTDLKDGETCEMQGSGKKPYVLKNTGGVYSCTCAAWCNQSLAINQRTCKHLRKLRGDDAEIKRVGSVPPAVKKEEKVVPPLLLAERWDGVSDPTEWWLSEKLDGVRAYWNGKQFLSRQGNVYHAPDWFIEKLPKLHLDGELWIGRKQFQHTVSIVRRQDKSDHWKEVRYLVFDAPKIDARFEDRMRFVKEALKGKPPYAIVHEQYPCKGIAHLREELAKIEKAGGEGLMLRQRGSKYQIGRSQTLLKVKSFLDAEARVIEHLEGEGRHTGRLGALLVELENGKRFSVGTGLSDAERESPPPVGSIINFRYQELSDGGIPRFPSYVGIRDDG